MIILQPKDEGFHGQEKVYHDLGEEMLDHSFEGMRYTYSSQIIGLSIIQYYTRLSIIIIMSNITRL